MSRIQDSLTRVLDAGFQVISAFNISTARAGGSQLQVSFENLLKLPLDIIPIIFCEVVNFGSEDSSRREKGKYHFVGPTGEVKLNQERLEEILKNPLYSSIQTHVDKPSYVVFYAPYNGVTLRCVVTEQWLHSSFELLQKAELHDRPPVPPAKWYGLEDEIQSEEVVF